MNFLALVGFCARCEADRVLKIKTNFAAALFAELEPRAEVACMVVRKSLSKTLDYLEAGPNAGPSKLD